MDSAERPGVGSGGTVHPGTLMPQDIGDVGGGSRYNHVRGRLDELKRAAAGAG
jgi:hypothetical protein